jgi:hypothetical protein
MKPRALLSATTDGVRPYQQSPSTRGEIHKEKERERERESKREREKERGRA